MNTEATSCQQLRSANVAVVIPCYKVTRHIIGVIAAMPPVVTRIYAVDDACPDGSGQYVAERCSDPRVTVLRNPSNCGVGGAVMNGYRRAVADGADVIVKVDGDGQMDPDLISCFIDPILSGRADYTKGNRFFDLSDLQKMPPIRIFGNAVLSLMSKLSTGYWDIFDPTNGYTAISGRVAAVLPFQKISERYFFETDMLFRLGSIRAVVMDVPMHASYADEESGLKIGKILHEFLFKHIRNFFKRIFYVYFLRDLSAASIELVGGLMLLVTGLGFGAYKWLLAAEQGRSTPFGTVMLAALMIILGFQLLLAFLAYDSASVPRVPIADRLTGLRKN